MGLIATRCCGNTAVGFCVTINFMQFKMKAIFLDIDGVLQPIGQQDRFQHMNEIRSLCEQLNSKLNNGIDYVRLFDSNGSAKYDIAAVYYDWDAHSVELIKRLLDEEQAVIVFSTSWRENGFDILKELFSIHGLDKYVYGETDTIALFNYRKNFTSEPEEERGREYWRERKLLRDSAFEELKTELLDSGKFPNINYLDSRSIEILEYLDRHSEITQYVAIDDLNLAGLDGHLVETRAMFSDDNFEPAKHILSLDGGSYHLPENINVPSLMEYRQKYLTPEVFLPNNGYSCDLEKQKALENTKP